MEIYIIKAVIVVYVTLLFAGTTGLAIAVGCVVYTLLTGKSPSWGKHAHLSHAHSRHTLTHAKGGKQ